MKEGQGVPDYLSEEELKHRPAWATGDGRFRDYVPDPEAEAHLPENQREIKITAEQERYGLNGIQYDKDGKIIDPLKRTVGTFNPLNG